MAHHQMNKKSTDSPVVLGRVSGLFGVRGWVKIHSHTSPRENILYYKRWNLSLDGKQLEVALSQGHRQSKGIVALIDGFNERTASEQLIGAEISVGRDELKSLKPGEYYWSDLIGCQVINLEGELLGEVEDMIETGANDVMVVKGEGGERLLPFVDPWLVEVELEKKRITVEWEADF